MTKEEEKRYFKYKFPDVEKDINFRLKTNIYNVSPKYWMDSSGMKFDNEGKNFYGKIPGTDIYTILHGTGFYVDEDRYDSSEVDDFIFKTLNTADSQRKSDIFEFDFALSFAGEDREIVEELALYLEKLNVKVFYDYFYKTELLGKDLLDHFKKIYGSKTSRFVIVFISKNYRLKDWTNFEFEIALDEAKRRKTEYILPIKLDDTKIPSIKRSIGHIDYYKEGIDNIIKILVDKLKQDKKNNI